VTVIYHRAAGADWEQAQRDGQYIVSTRGRTLAEEGFIHASTAGQVPLVAGAYYRGVPDLVLLVIDTERVRPELRYKQVPGQPDLYPHIYDPLNTDAVTETRPLRGPRLTGAAERAAEEVDLEQEHVLRHRRLRGHVRDAGQRQHLVRIPGRQQRAGQAQRVGHHHVVVRQPVDQHEREIVRPVPGKPR
jgi:uncharacterized protein (DUF952 family)